MLMPGFQLWPLSRRSFCYSSWWLVSKARRHRTKEEREHAHPLTAGGVPAPPFLLSPFPVLSGSPSGAGCPSCVECHSTRCLHWGPGAVKTRPRWGQSPGEKSQRGVANGKSGETGGTQVRLLWGLHLRASKDLLPRCSLLEEPALEGNSGNDGRIGIHTETEDLTCFLFSIFIQTLDKFYLELW